MTSQVYKLPSTETYQLTADDLSKAIANYLNWKNGTPPCGGAPYHQCEVYASLSSSNCRAEIYCTPMSDLTPCPICKQSDFPGGEYRCHGCGRPTVHDPVQEKAK